jgi:cytochrome c peroxidase
MSCATCHDPALAFGDGRSRATGFGGTALERNTPTLLNIGYARSLFWDGRASSLEEQARGPLLSPAEMHGGRAAAGRAPAGRSELRRGLLALAAYQRLLVTPKARFDRYLGGDRGALSPREKRGLALFVGKASCTHFDAVEHSCSNCHRVFRKELAGS